MNEWKSVKDELPIIPKDHFGVSVLVAMYDSQYAHTCKNPLAGWIVAARTYGTCDDLPMYKNSELKADFLEKWDMGDDYEWGPTGDPVYFWMYMPEAPDTVPQD